MSRNPSWKRRQYIIFECPESGSSKLLRFAELTINITQNKIKGPGNQPVSRRMLRCAYGLIIKLLWFFIILKLLIQAWGWFPILFFAFSGISKVDQMLDLGPLIYCRNIEKQQGEHQLFGIRWLINAFNLMNFSVWTLFFDYFLFLTSTLVLTFVF